MRMYGARVALLVPFLALAPMAMAHCSGSSGAAPQGARKGDDASTMAASDDASTPQGDDAGIGLDGTTTDGSVVTGVDAGTDAMIGPAPIPVPDAGAPSDPGTVVCNGAPCAVTAGYSCCVEKADDGGTKETCAAPNSPTCGGLTIRCNEASDCASGVCCQEITGIASPGSTSCMTSCPGPGTETFQTCRTNAECGSGDGGDAARCVPQLCSNTFPMRTLRIESCALPTLGNTAGTLAYCAAL
jgi:hypothetical protein